MNNKDKEFVFYENEGPRHSNEFEDIISHSNNPPVEEAYSFNSFSAKGKYKKKRHGFTGKIADWWDNRRGWQKGLIISGISFVLIFSIALSILRIVFDYNYKEITEDPLELGFENVVDEKIVNVALFGIDTRNTNSFKGNSDSIMILSLNTQTKKVKIISVLRDSLVPITYNGKTTYTKINSAYTKGPETAIKTLNNIFGLDISEYATVNFFGMVDIIDAVGGIDAELTKGEVGKLDGTLHHINGCIQEICQQLKVDPKPYYIYTAGKHHLNGIQAVAYSRIRYVANIWGTNNDYGRTDRQRYVMEQLFNKAVTLEKSQYVKLAKALIPCSETSLSYSEIMGLAFDILLDSPSFSQARVPMQEYTMKAPSTPAGSVVYYDLDFAKKLIHDFIYEDITPEDNIKQNGVEKNDWYRNKFGDSSYSSGGQNGNTNTDNSADYKEPTVNDKEPNENTEPVNPDTGNDSGDTPDNPEQPIEPDNPSDNPDEPNDDTAEEPDLGNDNPDKTEPENGGTDSGGQTDGGDAEEPSDTQTGELSRGRRRR